MHFPLSVSFSATKLQTVSGLTSALTLFLLLLILSSLDPSTVLSASQTKAASSFQDYLDIKRNYLWSLSDEYLKKSKDPPATQQTFLRLYKSYVDSITNNSSRQVWSELDRDAAALLKLEPTEPLSRVVAGFILLNAALNKNVLENCKMVNKAAGEMKGYSLAARLYAASALHKTVFTAHFRKTPEERAIANLHLNLLLEWMSQGNDSPEHLQRLMFHEAERFIALKFPPKFDILSSFIEGVEAGDEKIKPWLSNMLLAELYSKQAWSARGTGYAASVTEEGWENFHQGLKLAEEKLQIAYELHPERPEAASAMITIAMAGDTDDDERTWFDRAVDAEFDYTAAYSAYLSSLRPRWGGSNEAMIEFAFECVGSGRFDTSVPFITSDCFDKIYSEATGTLKEDPTGRTLVESMRDLDLYPKLHEVCQGYEAFLKRQEHISDYDISYYRARDFAFACKLRRYKDAYELYQKHDGNVLHPSVQISNQVPGNITIAHVIAANGAAAGDIESIEDQTHYFAGQFRTLAECEVLLAEIEKAADKNELVGAEPYFQTKSELVQKEIDFHRGQWVNLEFTQDLRHWSRYGGRRTVESPTSMVVVNTVKESQYVAYNTLFPPPYEVELTVEGRENHFRKRMLPAGLVCGRMHGPQNGRLFFVDTFRHQAGFGQPVAGSRGFPTLKKKSLRMKVYIFEEYFEMLVGKDEIHKNQEGFKPGRLGVALTPWTDISGDVRYSDLRVRKLNFSKPPAVDDYKAQIDYYQRRLEHQKTFLTHMLLANANFELQQHEKAIAEFKEAGILSPNTPTPDLFIGRAWQRLKRYDQARQMMESALNKCAGTQKYHRAEVLKYLTWIYATCPSEEVRDGDKAVECAEEMLKLKTKRRPLNWIQLSVIAAAYAEAGQFEDAIKYVRAAIKKSGKDQLDGLKKKLELYQDGKPFHEVQRTPIEDQSAE